MAEFNGNDEPDLEGTRPLAKMPKNALPSESLPSATHSANPEATPGPTMQSHAMPPVVAQVVKQRPPSQANAAQLSVTRLEWAAGRPLSGRYQMVEKLGEGGMGTVYLCDDLLLRRRVALKTLWDEDAFDKGDLERFRKEVALAHAINHPNIARTYDLGASGGVQFIAMEHLKGETLMSRIRRGPPLTPKEVREFAVPVCYGLRAAHKVGVVHRDLKPANIMLVPDERKVVILDFGIARSVGDVAVALDAGTAERASAGGGQTPWDVTSAGLGTPAYMAPEQWDEASGDQRTDIYSLGVILYVCLTGQAPYSANTADELGDRHRSAAIPDVAAIAKGVDRDLANLIKHCLAKKPKDRPQTMDAVIDRLERASRRKKYTLQMTGVVIATALLLTIIGIALYSMVAGALLHEMKPGLARLATLMARDIDVNDLDKVHTERDIQTPPFARVQKVLDTYHRDNPEIIALYTMRKVKDPAQYEIVVDIRPSDEDLNGDGKIEGAEQKAPPGEAYDGRPYPAMAKTLETGKAQTDDSFIRDKWEISLSGYAPILRNGVKGEYFVGVDASNLQLEALQTRLRIVLGIALAIVVSILAVILLPSRQQRRALEKSDRAHAKAQV